jgi:hypothetical protein
MALALDTWIWGIHQALLGREVVTGSDKPRTVAHRFIIEASIDAL